VTSSTAWTLRTSRTLEKETLVKVVAYNGSARKDANTALLVRTVFEELEAAGVS
jgi:hypothetical protein